MLCMTSGILDFSNCQLVELSQIIKISVPLRLAGKQTVKCIDTLDTVLSFFSDWKASLVSKFKN